MGPWVRQHRLGANRNSCKGSSQGLEAAGTARQYQTTRGLYSVKAGSEFAMAGLALDGPVPRRVRVLEREPPPALLLSEFSACEATPERLCMLTTLFDPSQFGGRFFFIGPRNGQCTIFSELIESWLRISQRGGQENRLVHKRIEEFQRTVRRLVKDLGMPINFQGGFHCLSEYHHNNYLLDWAAWLGSWMAFAAFLEYFPELRRTVHSDSTRSCRWNPFHVQFWEPRPQFNADLPFVLDKLLPYISHYGSAHRHNIPRELLQTISDMLDEAIERAHHDDHSTSCSSRHRNP